MHGPPDTSGSGQLMDRCMREPEFARRYDVSNAKVLGHGSFGCVARVHDRDLDQDVAVKMFWRVTPELRARIRAEVANAQRVRSETVVQVHSVFFGNEGAWLQMELVDGPSLEAELERRSLGGTPLPTPEALRIARDAVDALAKAHEVGVLHRDLKPSNFVMTPDGPPFVKLGDFGISKHRDASALTATGEFPGTPAYAALEIFEGRPTGTATDVYSMGLVLFRLLANGTYAYELSERPTPMEYMSAHRNGRPRRLRGLAPDVPVAVEQAIADALARNPKERPDAATLRNVIDLACRGIDAPASPARRHARVRRVVYLSGLSAAVLLGLGLASVRWDQPDAVGTASLRADPTQRPAPAPIAGGAQVVPASVITSAAAGTNVLDSEHVSVAAGAPVPPATLAARPTTGSAAAASKETAKPVPFDGPVGVEPVERTSRSDAAPATASVASSALAAPSEAPPVTQTSAPVSLAAADPAPVSLAAAPVVPAAAPRPAAPQLRVLPTVVVGGGGTPGREHQARLDLQVIPSHVMPGEPYVVEVRLANQGARPVRISDLSLVDTRNGERRGSPASPLSREVKPGRQELVNRVAGRWPQDLKTWTLEVFLTADEGDTFKSAVTWR